ncbi:PucR family transcriptional regulator [Nocardia thailandica]|uniref:PucR family transcriptional regulator n=1 Tax=Nocardia thailandica TaxID=257275 RepID=UPI0002D39C77|nr:helix-turn-helix domain-containing protein [Nocardia thailandica]
MTAGGTTVRALLTALDSTVATLICGDDTVVVRTAAIAEPADLTGESPPADLLLLVGVDAAALTRWLRATAGDRAGPRAVLAKHAAVARADAAAAGVALIEIHRQARWDQVFPLVRRVLARAASGAAEDPVALDADLFGLAQVLARDTGGMVSVEDPGSRVLAYSASDAAADELRIRSILGREGPPEYLRILREWGVFERLRAGDDVVDIPAHPELGMKRRLAVAIRRGDAAVLGTVWLQQGDTPLQPDAAAILRGAAAVAARIIARRREAPSTEAMLARRLFGAHGDGVDIPSVAAALNLTGTGPAAVIGVAADPGRPEAARAASLIRLHASAFRADSVTETIGDRVYVLLPGYHTEAGVTSWLRSLVEQWARTRSVLVRAALAAPVADLAAVAAARAEVDRVLDRTVGATGAARVTTLARARTAVLLGEILALAAARPDLRDPRLATLSAYDRDHATDLRATLAAYLAAHGDVRAAATAVGVHPNTLRYRLRRAQDLLGLTLDDPADRLLLEIQLAMPEPERESPGGGF